jgi:polyhydroxybutyrate depolymerase
MTHLSPTRRFTAALLALSACAGVLMAFAATARGTTTAGCSVTSTAGTVGRQAMGRDYHVNVPAGLTGPAPLLLSLHGAAQAYSLHEGETRWSTIAATKHFIVAYPAAAGLMWDFAQHSGDVDYLLAVVKDIAQTWCVDPHRIHVEGFSSGANMSARLACDASTVFASVAAFSGISPSLTGSPCQPARPISVGLFHTDADVISLPPLAEKHRDEWVQRNGCPTTPVTEPGVPVAAARYGPCTAGTEVVWRVYHGSHFWPTGDDRTDISTRMWDFFTRNPLP